MKIMKFEIIQNQVDLGFDYLISLWLHVQFAFCYMYVEGKWLGCWAGDQSEPVNVRQMNKS